MVTKDFVKTIAEAYFAEHGEVCLHDILPGIPRDPDFNVTKITEFLLEIGDENNWKITYVYHVNRYSL